MAGFAATGSNANQIEIPCRRTGDANGEVGGEAIERAGLLAAGRVSAMVNCPAQGSTGAPAPKSWAVKLKLSITGIAVAGRPTAPLSNVAASRPEANRAVIHPRLSCLPNCRLRLSDVGLN